VDLCNIRVVGRDLHRPSPWSAISRAPAAAGPGPLQPRRWLPNSPLINRHQPGRARLETGERGLDHRARNFAMSSSRGSPFSKRSEPLQPTPGRLQRPTGPWVMAIEASLAAVAKRTARGRVDWLLALRPPPQGPSGRDAAAASQFRPPEAHHGSAPSPSSRGASGAACESAAGSKRITCRLETPSGKPPGGRIAPFPPTGIACPVLFPARTPSLLSAAACHERGRAQARTIRPAGRRPAAAPRSAPVDSRLNQCEQAVRSGFAGAGCRMATRWEPSAELTEQRPLSSSA